MALLFTFLKTSFVLRFNFESSHKTIMQVACEVEKKSQDARDGKLHFRFPNGSCTKKTRYKVIDLLKLREDSVFGWSFETKIPPRERHIGK